MRIFVAITISALAIGLVIFACNGPSVKPGADMHQKNTAITIPVKDLSRPQFELKNEWSPTTFSKDFKPGTRVDVILGQTDEELIRAAWFQLTGKLPSEETIETWLAKFQANPKLRRIDVIVAMANELSLQPKYTYSDPWKKQLRSLDAPRKRVKRDVGAVFMFFFNCPGGVNGKMSWANNHSPGMDVPAEILKMSPDDSGYYDPSNPGFWLMELLDARYAGLQFLLLNTYGPDLKSGLKPMRQALQKIDSMELRDTVKLGLFDDTWSWGKPYFDKIWEQTPDLADVENCAKTIFEGKWKPFFKAVPRKHWYLVRGRPVIYFYNGGTLKNRQQSAPAFKRLKELFKEEFGVEPFLCVDRAFGGEGIEDVADQRFRWFAIDKPVADATHTMKGTTLTHAMVRWDSTARHNKQVECVARPGDRIYKDDTLLKRLLNDSRESDLLVVATWNDLGEGTGINRCYDYYWKGQWQRPTHFMELIRASQEGRHLAIKP